MSKEELLDCLKNLSKTNNLRDGVDIRKEEANIIVNEIERLNNIINELEEWLEDKDKNALQDDNYWEVLDKLQKLKENI